MMRVGDEGEWVMRVCDGRVCRAKVNNERVCYAKV